jgi:hypothetical protein
MNRLRPSGALSFDRYLETGELYMAKKKSPPTAQKASPKKPPAKKKASAKKKAPVKMKLLSSAGGGLELTITTAHKTPFGVNAPITITGTLSTTTGVTLSGWLATGENVDGVVTLGTNWQITFPGQSTAGTYAVYARATLSGHAAVDQILVVVS